MSKNPTTQDEFDSSALRPPKTNLKKRRREAQEALARLRADPGSPGELFDELVNLVERPQTTSALAGAFARMSHRPDRDAALVYGAVLEQSLETALASCLVADKKAAARLYDSQSTGPLSTFHSKIILGRALGLYGEEMEADLLMLKEIRNTFAHSKAHIAFDSDGIKTACELLQCDMRQIDPEALEHHNLSRARASFTFTVALLSAYLNTQGQRASPRFDQRGRVYGSLYPAR